MKTVTKSNQRQAMPNRTTLKRFFKHQLSCPYYLRIMRYHANIFRYAEYDLDPEQSRLSEIDGLRV